MAITPEILSVVAAAVISLLFSYVPNLRVGFAKLAKETQQLIMLGILAVTAAAAYGLSCAGWLEGLFGAALACDQAGFMGLVRAFIFAVMANQGIYGLTPKAPDVTFAREIRDGKASLSIGKG